MSETETPAPDAVGDVALEGAAVGAAPVVAGEPVNGAAPEAVPQASDPQGGDARTLAHDLIARLVERSLTIATCESLTGGGVCALLTSVPGSSRVVRGGLITYATDLKVALAGVDADWVASRGVVNETTAVQMATGALRACEALVAVSCTGVAGPDPQDGHEVGDVWLAVAMAGEPEMAVATRRLHLGGDRSQIREECAQQALRLVLDQMR